MAIGLKPLEVRALSLADFTAACNGFLAAHGRGPASITSDDVAELRLLLEDEE